MSSTDSNGDYTPIRTSGSNPCEVMTSVVDLTNSSVNASTPLLVNRHERRSKWSKICSDGPRGVACFPEEPSFELVENLPCLFKPFDYFLKERFPFIQWLRHYSLSCLVSDVIAGLTVGLMVVPQALAYASIAGLPLQYGLYSSFMGVMVYMFFGTSKDVTLGPTAIMSLLTAAIIGTSAGSSDYSRVHLAILLTLFSGMVQFLLGILNLGFLIEFISQPVISGFTSAAAITIAAGQFKSLFGIEGSVRRPFIQCMYDTVYNIIHWDLNYWDLIFGIVCIVLVVLLKYFKLHIDSVQAKIKMRYEKLKWYEFISLKFLWILCTARNALIVFCGGLIGFALVMYNGGQQEYDNFPLTLVQYDAENELPSFSVPNVTLYNIEELDTGIIVAPLIGFLESIAISKAFARQNMYNINPTQELIALGLSNIVSSFFGSYPVTGSFSRTAVNSQSGVKTPAAAIVTCGVVLLATSVVSQGFDYIPKTALASIIIAAVVFMIDFQIIYKIWKIKKLEDMATLTVSFLGTLLLGIEYGVPMATGLSLLILLYRRARPKHEINIYDKLLYVSFNGEWSYPGAEYIWKRIRYELGNLSTIKDQVIYSIAMDFSSISVVDYTIIENLREGCKELEKKFVAVILVNVKPHIRATIEASNISNLQFSLSLDMATQMTEELYSNRNDAVLITSRKS